MHPVIYNIINYKLPSPLGLIFIISLCIILIRSFL
nr:MAG TPA: hypothetical protein [Caudoviricetes sp.]